jgi:hypothetical protein
MASARASPHKGRGWPCAYPAATYYRRRAKAREQAALAAREAVLDRLQWLSLS